MAIVQLLKENDCLLAAVRNNFTGPFDRYFKNNGDEGQQLKQHVRMVTRHKADYRIYSLPREFGFDSFFFLVFFFYAGFSKQNDFLSFFELKYLALGTCGLLCLSIV